ncbi:cutinase family protein [Corynebacterium jeikeium]|uniref:cutinase family protein n=2 Tax=Corynebacterium jeikeium TaxID=38289 RepID=UPI0001B7186B|nr:cutinase family protein [Corynebacterium jeikeium]EEW16499.1 Cutinase [Corynebacterium jeikeium ATCC 43734]OOD29884.1 carbohydrate esterase [Corynebacterium jeikeium]WCZ52684.1 Cutinase [Corynebacterium jeikeium]SUY82010.1 envelope lipids regulation factor [Corynebacterium jeikeium]
MKKVLTILAVLVLLALIVVGVGNWLLTNDGGDGPGPGKPTPPPAPEAQNPPGCVDVEVLAAPGTWESKADDDPLAPHANPHSLMLNVTRPLGDEFSPDKVKVWTLPYTAQFRNMNAQHEMSYDDSRNQGFERMKEELRSMHEKCPATSFILTGFSQGAVITGDLAGEIGNGRGPVPADRVLGVSLIADGRQELDKGKLVGAQGIRGTGAEIALNPVSGLIQPIVPGATMRGPRPDGFGELNDRVNNYCAPADLICDAPADLGNALVRAKDLVAANAVHAEYATNGKVVEGQTVPEYIVGWARDLINERVQ